MTAAPFEALISELHERLRGEAKSDPIGWRRRAEVGSLDEALTRAGTPEAFLAWARDHRQRAFVVAESAGEICAKPREAAIYVLGAILAEILDETESPSESPSAL